MEVSKPEASPQKYLNAQVKTSIKKGQHNSQSKEGFGGDTGDTLFIAGLKRPLRYD